MSKHKAEFSTHSVIIRSYLTAAKSPTTLNTVIPQFCYKHEQK